MLLSQRAGGTSVGFGLGRVTGILAATGIVVVLAGSIDTSREADPSPAVAWLKIGLGILLLALAVKQWRGRADASTPRWMKAIDQLTLPKAAGLGVVLAAVNPKNLLLCVSAGVLIGNGGLAVGGEIVAVLVYTVLAASTVLVPVLGYAVAADRMRGGLDSLKNWLQANNHMVMAIVLVVMGAVVIGKGLGGL